MTIQLRSLHHAATRLLAWTVAVAIYVIPGDERWALTAEDLVDPKFHYLRPLV